MYDFLSHTLSGLISSLLFGLVGIFLLLFGFNMFDRLLPNVDFQESMKGNAVATAIVIAAFFISVAIIVASVIS